MVTPNRSESAASALWPLLFVLILCLLPLSTMAQTVGGSDNADRLSGAAEARRVEAREISNATERSNNRAILGHFDDLPRWRFRRVMSSVRLESCVNDLRDFFPFCGTEGACPACTCFPEKACPEWRDRKMHDFVHRHVGFFYAARQYLLAHL